MTIFLLSLFAFIVNGILAMGLFFFGHPGGWLAIVVMITNLSIMVIAMNRKHWFDD